ncbi:MAG: YSIRK-type signal peptide-containing protein [Lactobacillus sp.]|nr:YSIRK-type signal peptide-containing protein [Lactobacillus sp.]
MLSKNNTKLHLKRMEPNKQHFTIKKFSVGVASVLVSCTFATYGTTTARAVESVASDETVEVVDDSSASTDSNVVTLSGENTSSATEPTVTADSTATETSAATSEDTETQKSSRIYCLEYR